MPRVIRLGTRPSKLARVQAELVAEKLRAISGFQVVEVLIRSEGDDSSGSLQAPIRPGVFVSTLRDSLLAGEVDLVVHSYKDLPSAQVDGLVIAAVPIREDSRDVLVSRHALSLEELTTGAVVGTSSPRRSARVKHLRPDVEVRPIRGNVDTRLQKVASGEYDAIVVAAAGLNRLGRAGEIAQFFDETQILAAPAQGALAIECLETDTELRGFLGQLDHYESRIIATAERAVLTGLSASCSTALGAQAVYFDGELHLVAELSHPNLDWHERVSLTKRIGSVSQAFDAGIEAAKILLQTELGAEISGLNHG